MTTELTRWLDELDAAREKATPGPWQYDPETPGEVWDSDERYPHVLGGCEESADAALIVAAVNALPELIRLARERYAIERAVLDLADQDEKVAQIARGKECAAKGDAADFWHTLAEVREQSRDRLRAAVTGAAGGGQP